MHAPTASPATSPSPAGPGWAGGLALAALLCASGCALASSRAPGLPAIVLGALAVAAAFAGLAALAADAGALDLRLGRVLRGRYLCVRYASADLPASHGPGLRFGPGLTVAPLRAWGVPDLDP